VKHITTGEGGAVATNNKELYEKLLLLRSHGIDKNALDRYGPNASWAYDMKYLGRNYRMTDFQAALGISQLKKLDGFINKRNELALKYNELLANIDVVTLPFKKDKIRHAWHLYTVLLNESVNRNEFFKYMRNANIGVNVHYIPVYRHSYYMKNFSHDPLKFTVTEDVFKRIITLPLYPKMSGHQIEYVVASISQAIKHLI
jgi:dTDP-4-amino-4,6-dideoxygalactose transaminase